MRTHLSIFVLAGTCTIALVQVNSAPSQPSGDPAKTDQLTTAAEKPTSSPTAIDSWTPRLAGLSPDAPEAYLLLAEEMLDGTSDPRVRRVASELLVLAIANGSTQGDTATASSAALALADTSADPQARRALRLLARALEPRLAPVSWNLPRKAANAGSTDYQIAVAIGNARSGQGAYVQQALRRTEVSTRADATSPILEQFGLTGGRDWIERTARNWPCPECSNALITRRGNERRLCGTCKGMPGPALSTTEYVATLRAELFLLRGDESEWSRQLAVDSGEPLQTLDIAGVSKLFNVNVSKGYFRNNRWTTNADGTDPAPVVPEGEQATPAPSPAPQDPTQPQPMIPGPQQPTQPSPFPNPSPSPSPNPLPAVPGLPTPQPTTPPSNPQPTNPSEDPLPGEVPINIPALPPMNPQPQPQPVPPPK